MAGLVMFDKKSAMAAPSRVLGRSGYFLGLLWIARNAPPAAVVLHIDYTGHFGAGKKELPGG
jgi:hypothetical protein